MAKKTKMPKIDFNAISGAGTKENPLMYKGKKYTGTVPWSTGPAKYVNGVKLTTTTSTDIRPDDAGGTISTVPVPEPTAENPIPGPTGPTPTSATGPTATGPTNAQIAKSYGIGEALFFDPKYGKPDEKTGLWWVVELEKQGRFAEAQEAFAKTDWAKLDQDAKDRYLLSLEKSAIYNERLKEWTINLKKLLRQNNLQLDDAKIKDYFDRGIDPNIIIDELISTATPDNNFGGNTLQALKAEAFNNGINLETVFGTDQIIQWMRDVASGTPLDNFIKKIRQEAGKGKSGYVKQLLDSGQSLRQIYSTYIGAIAETLGVDPATITLDDPLLKNAFSEAGPMSMLDFGNLIRKDARYGKTKSATAEKDFRQSIVNTAIKLGVQLNDAAVDEILNTALSQGLTSVTPQVEALIRSKFTLGTQSSATGPTAVSATGSAGNALEILRQTAIDNGLDLDKQFGTEIQDWLSKILAGEPVSTFQREIRRVAGTGLSDRIKSMLEAGTNLKSIYAPYRNTMAALLELSPDSIQLSDPTLQAALGGEKEMPIYEFQRALRKDPRWQYTDNARQDVSTSALRVLRDFGFQG